MNTSDAIEKFIEDHGRRPRGLISTIASGTGDQEAKAFASSLADVGFDIDLAPSTSSADDIVRQAVENDVHVIGVCVDQDTALATALFSAIHSLLVENDAEDILLMAYVYQSESDPGTLLEAGVHIVATPETHISKIADKVLDSLSANET